MQSPTLHKVWIIMEDGEFRSTQNICTPPPFRLRKHCRKGRQKECKSRKKRKKSAKMCSLNVLNTAIVKQLYLLAVSLDKSPNGQLWMGKGLIGSTYLLDNY